MKSPDYRFYICEEASKMILIHCLPSESRTLQTSDSLIILLQWMKKNNYKNRFSLVQGENPLQNWR